MHVPLLKFEELAVKGKDLMIGYESDIHRLYCHKAISWSKLFWTLGQLWHKSNATSKRRENGKTEREPNQLQRWFARFLIRHAGKYRAFVLRLLGTATYVKNSIFA